MCSLPIDQREGRFEYGFPSINAKGDFEYGLVPVPVVSAHGARRSASPMQFCTVGDHIVLHAKLSNFEATTVLSPSTAVM
jgi:hypothetical protein